MVARVNSIFAATGNGKSTMVLKDKRRKAYFEFDAGSFERAESGLTLMEGQVDIYRFHPPFDLDVFTDAGILDKSMVGDSGKGAVQVIHHLTGWNEQLVAFRKQFALCIQDATIQDIIFDTQDDLWTMEQNAFKQRMQDEIGIDKARMNRLEYQEGNTHMLQYCAAAKSRGKNLYFVCHETDEWKGGAVTGKLKPAGWNDGPEKSDITIQLRRRDKKPYAVVFKAGGADMALIDMEIEGSEDYPLNMVTVNHIVDCATAIRKAGQNLPDTIEKIIQRGEMLDVEYEG